ERSRLPHGYPDPADATTRAAAGTRRRPGRRRPPGAVLPPRQPGHDAAARARRADRGGLGGPWRPARRPGGTVRTGLRPARVPAATARRGHGRGGYGDRVARAGPFADLPGAAVKPDADVIILGAGIVGLSTAAELARRGATVAVLDPHHPGGRGTRAAAGVAVPSLRLLRDPVLAQFAAAAQGRLDAQVREWSDAGVSYGHGVIRPSWNERERQELTA